MTRLQKTVLIAALAGLALLPFARRATTLQTAKAQDNKNNATAKPAKVTYLPIPAGDYRMDAAHSVIGFSIRHNELVLVSGRFKDFSGTIHYDNKDVAKSSVEFKAKVESIDTGVE